MLTILGVAGSLRSDSWNRRLLESAAKDFPDDIALELHPIGDLPHYNADLDGEHKPPAVRLLLDRVAAADALLIATPEYNYSIPGVLKNALDWASRPAFRSPLAHKPAGVMSASPSTAGGARAQAHLKLILLAALAPVYPAPELIMPAVQNLFDERGELVERSARERLQRYIGGYTDWVRSEAGKG